MILTREQILAASDRQTVGVEAWGGVVFVRSLTVGEQLALEARIKDLRAADKTADMLVAQLAAYLSNEQGGQLFDEQAASALLDRKPATIQKILTAAQKLNGWTPDAEDEIRKN